MKAMGIENSEKEQSMKKVVLAVLFSVLIMAGSNLWAQDQDKPVEPVEQPKRPEVEKPITPLRVQVVFTEFDGEKKISSLPYTFLVNADEKGPQAAVRLVLHVPVTFIGGDGSKHTDNNTINTGIDGRAEKTPDGRFTLQLSVFKDSIYLTGSGEKPTTLDGSEVSNKLPITQHLQTQVNLLLRDGQTIQSTAATDPVTGHSLRVDVTLNVIK
jgi:hypothetical protein